MGINVWLVALAIVLGFAGGFVQGVIGFGMGVLAVPILALVDPSLVPVATLLAGAGLPVMTLLQERQHLDKKALGWVLLGQTPTTALGVWLVAVLPLNGLKAVIAALVLMMVFLSVVRIRVPLTPVTLTGAGAISGVSGTAAGIGGPPIAIVMADMTPAAVRATLAATFLVGTAVSLGGLAMGGVVQGYALVIGVLMMPATLLGMAASRRARNHLTPKGFRIGMLTLSTVSASILLIDALF
ncbi:sulfite exporter TauE/SafE family protein [Tessaracoccus caeni]|uniref:sulfite exporter TauE/SafE family protein n=1 Tax=Tessaracoccus caeni TaxID=3031239 RepID=UPI0023DBF7C5|nr:sulfite exporter TauE/SafE family protein [Tessaracoccus caeni]MDF1490196.1 sulfite exporter TauE/SafE family protein [Tessaracoccus caeni]